MTYHEKISAYIDNELSHDAEQDFLISLASNESVRRAFRSELIMKNVIHQDELATQPKRDLRGVLLGTLGIGTAAAVTEEAAAATSAVPSFWQSVVASKINAVFVAGIVTVSAVTGYVTHEVLNPATPEVITRTVVQPAEAPREIDPSPVVTAPENTEQTPAVTEAPRKVKAAKKAAQPTETPTNISAEPTTTSGVGTTTIETNISK
jgi:hypothetical protein